MPAQRDPGTYSVKRKRPPVQTVNATLGGAGVAAAQAAARSQRPARAAEAAAYGPSGAPKAPRAGRNRERQQAVKALERIISDSPTQPKKVKLSHNVPKPTVVKLKDGKVLAVPPKTVDALTSGNTQKVKRATREVVQPAKPVKPVKPKAAKKPPLQKVQRQFKQGKRLLPGLDAEQTRVAAKVLSRGQKAGATKKELTAAAETGIVESGFRNLSYGDADSQGWRQERASLYPNPTNVKDSADRYFSETASAGRGKGQSAGTLAQSVQRSAFPERYDEVRGQAKPIVQAFTRGKAPKAVKQKPGAYAGSQRAVLELLPKGVRAEGRNDKRTPAENAAVGGATASDHLTTNKASYAADIPPDPATYAGLRKKLGLPPAQTGMDSVTKDGYRYQLIFGAQYGHGDHIHLGAQWTGAAGTSVTAGAAMTGGTAPSATSGASSGPSSDAAKSRRVRRARRMQGRARSRLIRELIAEGPGKAIVSPTTSTTETEAVRVSV